jgi:hypothetical protein
MIESYFISIRGHSWVRPETWRLQPTLLGSSVLLQNISKTYTKLRCVSLSLIQFNFRISVRKDPNILRSAAYCLSPLIESDETEYKELVFYQCNLLQFTWKATLPGGPAEFIRTYRINLVWILWDVSTKLDIRYLLCNFYSVRCILWATLVTKLPLYKNLHICFLPFGRLWSDLIQVTAFRLYKYDGT